MDHTGLRNLRDFLMQYNKISESCFLHCVNHLSNRSLSQDECGCVDMCTKKHVSVNHKVMQVYMEVQPIMINKRVEEMNKQQAALEESRKKELAANEKNAVTGSEKPTKVEKLQDAKNLVRIKSDGDIPEKEIVRTEYQ